MSAYDYAEGDKMVNSSQQMVSSFQRVPNESQRLANDSQRLANDSQRFVSDSQEQMVEERSRDVDMLGNSTSQTIIDASKLISGIKPVNVSQLIVSPTHINADSQNNIYFLLRAVLLFLLVYLFTSIIPSNNLIDSRTKFMLSLTVVFVYTFIDAIRTLYEISRDYMCNHVCRGQ